VGDRKISTLLKIYRKYCQIGKYVCECIYRQSLSGCKNEINEERTKTRNVLDQKRFEYKETLLSISGVSLLPRNRKDLEKECSRLIYGGEACCASRAQGLLRKGVG
jgi:hypothetical protein